MACPLGSSRWLSRVPTSLAAPANSIRRCPQPQGTAGGESTPSFPPSGMGLSWTSSWHLALLGSDYGRWQEGRQLLPGAPRRVPTTFTCHHTLLCHRETGNADSDILLWPSSGKGEGSKKDRHHLPPTCSVVAGDETSSSCFLWWGCILGILA